MRRWCSAGEWRINRWTYEVPAGTAQQASALNDALAELDGRILFVPYGVRQRDSQLIETYVARDVYIVEYETLLQSGALADGVLDLTAEAVGPEYPGRAYTDLDTADWVLAADGVPVDTSALEKADAACPAGHGRIWNPPLRKGVCRYNNPFAADGIVWNPPARKGVCRYRPTCFSAPQTGTGRRGRRPLQT